MSPNRGCWSQRVNRQRANIGLGQAAVDWAPVSAAIRAFEHAAAICPPHKGWSASLGHRQRSNMGIDQAGVDRAPVSATVYAFEHASPGSRIEGGRRRRSIARE